MKRTAKNIASNCTFCKFDKMVRAGMNREIYVAKLPEYNTYIPVEENGKGKKVRANRI